MRLLGGGTRPRPVRRHVMPVSWHTQVLGQPCLEVSCGIVYLSLRQMASLVEQRAADIGLPEADAVEFRRFEERRVELRPAKVRTVEVRVFKVRKFEVCVAEVHRPELCILEFCRVEVRPAEVGPEEPRPFEVRLMALGQLSSSHRQSFQPWSRIVGDIFTLQRTQLLSGNETGESATRPRNIPASYLNFPTRVILSEDAPEGARPSRRTPLVAKMCGLARKRCHPERSDRRERSRRTPLAATLSGLLELRQQLLLSCGVPLQTQVLPLRVFFFEQRHLLGARPTLELLLARDGI